MCINEYLFAIQYLTKHTHTGSHDKIKGEERNEVWFSYLHSQHNPPALNCPLK